VLGVVCGVGVAVAVDCRHSMRGGGGERWIDWFREMDTLI
jgi:hypothetical protein